ncbi:hypothetical protein ACFWNT_13745 [Streptomyces sp. NPDC058409]|uniref:hypothetical protein n=1 Tax=Streptomyces sp. NPDC058409 TaxID=3346484 RepID=UPI003649887F
MTSLTTPWLDERLQAAEQAATDLAGEHRGADIWLVGALAERLAHTQSDVDLLLVHPAGPAPTLPSRLLRGIRIDIRAVTADTVNNWRTLLDDFTVTRDDVETFRRVRAMLPDLTLLRTARPLTGTPDAVLTPIQWTTYQRWALADRLEAAASLAEDLLGLAQAGLYPHADLVWDQLARIVAQAETVAAGTPLLGEKWLPSLLARTDDTDDQRAAVPVPVPPAPHWPSAATHSPWFAPVQLCLTEALVTLWPLEGTAAKALPEKGLIGFGWLPQRYGDGWFLRRGDARLPLSDGQMLAWQHAVAQRVRP